MIKKVLTIAGSDSSGGAGIQADIKTITCMGLYAMSAITSLTAQNTTGVYGVADTEPSFLMQQLDAVFTDIFPDSVKVGMVSNAENIGIISAAIKKYKPKHLVVDPVMISTSGSRLLNEDAMGALKSMLLPLAELITPNIPEAESLSETTIQDKGDMEKAAKIIFDEFCTATLVKGGHSLDNADDLLYDGKTFYWFPSERIYNKNTHGTGCTLSSAIACGLADGKSLYQSISEAKDYITSALKAGLDIGHGSGPLLHNFMLV